ncbi:type II secretion system F family protein [Microbacterium oleivorans]|uniref:type II secretion system F family protein n=1 Tax=Microbacterium oleivorans TaxID=273677 RepID=UPI00080D94EE|nr:type II secretion system F family protein [Microbacterium oleivorans]
MNLALIVLPGLILGLGIAVIVAALIPTQPRLASALDRIGTTSVATDTAYAATLENRVGSAVLRRFSDSSALKIPNTDLRLIGMSVNRYLYQKVLCAALGFVAPLALGLVAQVLGLGAFYVPALFGIALAAGGWFIPNLLIRSQAQEARTEFSRSIAVYMELVGSERISGAPPGKALESAAQVGRNWAFVRIRQTLTEARYAGVAPWDALEQLSKETGVPDLGEIANVIRLSGEQGASVYETLRARGQNLRDRLLNDEAAEANKATNKMTIPMALTGVLFMLLLGTPFALDAFS